MSRLILLLVLATTAVACNTIRLPSTEAVATLNAPPISEKNRIELAAIPGITKPKKNEILMLHLVNTSGDTIRFPQDYGIQVFLEKDGAWAPIRNNFMYTTGDVVLEPAGSAGHSDALVPLAPLVDETETPVAIRVVVTGSIYGMTMSTDEKATAEIQLTLQP